MALSSAAAAAALTFGGDVGGALERLAGLPETSRGIDVAALRRTASAARSVLDAGGVPDADWGPFPSRADAHAPGVWFAASADATGPSAEPTPVRS